MGYLTSSQLSEWEAYDKIDPIGEWREDLRMAVLAALIENIYISIYCTKQGETPKWVTIMDKMPDWEGGAKNATEPTQTVEQQKYILLTIARSQNKKVERENIRKNVPPKKKNKR